MTNVSRCIPSRRVKALASVGVIVAGLFLQVGASNAADYPPNPGSSLSPAPVSPTPPAQQSPDPTIVPKPLPPTATEVPIIQTTVKPGVPTNIEVLIDGKIVGAVLTVTTPTGAGSTGNSVAEIQGPGWFVTIRSTASSADTGGNSSQVITFETGIGTIISGTGFAPFTLVIVYIFSDPISIGQVITDAKGNFSGTFKIPEDLKVGDHTLQLSGQAPDGKIRTASVAVQVKNKVSAKPGVRPKPTSSSSAAPSATPAPMPTAVSVAWEKGFPLRWIILILLEPAFIWFILLRRR